MSSLHSVIVAGNRVVLSHRSYSIDVVVVESIEMKLIANFIGTVGIADFTGTAGILVLDARPDHVDPNKTVAKLLVTLSSQVPLRFAPIVDGIKCVDEVTSDFSRKRQLQKAFIIAVAFCSQENRTPLQHEPEMSMEECLSQLKDTSPHELLLESSVGFNQEGCGVFARRELRLRTKELAMVLAIQKMNAELYSLQTQVRVIKEAHNNIRAHFLRASRTAEPCAKMNQHGKIFASQLKSLIFSFVGGVEGNGEVKRASKRVLELCALMRVHFVDE